MGLDYANERWRKVYVRDTGTWAMLDWRTRGVILELVRKCDDSGRIFAGKTGLRGIARLLGAEYDEILPYLTEAIDCGKLVWTEPTGELVVEGHVERQEVRTSDAERKRRSRVASANRSHDVTARHTVTGHVTGGHDQIRSEETRTEETRAERAEAGAGPVADEGVETTKTMRLADRETRYAMAYARGVSKGIGSTWAWPGGYGDQPALNQTIAAHAKDADGKSLRDDALIAWIEEHAALFAGAVHASGEDVRFWSGLGPKGFLKFANPPNKWQVASGERGSGRLVQVPPATGTLWKAGGGGL